jgi:hypothetical protein
VGPQVKRQSVNEIQRKREREEGGREKWEIKGKRKKR